MKNSLAWVAAVLFFMGSNPAVYSESDLLKASVYGTAEGARLVRALDEGAAAWSRIENYEAHFIKQESAGREPGPEESLFLKFDKPFKIFLGWLNTPKKGLQVFYERGQHGGKLAIHKPGLLLGLAPVVFLDQSSPWVREGSAEFNIEDAGIGTFLTDFTEDVAEAEKQKRLQVRLVREDSEGLLMEVEFTDSKESETFMSRRVEVFFDAQSKLPTRMTLFRDDGTPIGRYAYEELKLNPGIQDSALKKQAHRKLFRLYIGDRG